MKNNKKSLIYIFLVIIFLVLMLSISYFILENKKLEGRIISLETSYIDIKEKVNIELSNMQNKLLEDGNLKIDEDNNLINNVDENFFQNTSIEGLTKITEKQAKEIWENYRKKYITSSDLEIDYKIVDIKIENVYPNNHLMNNQDKEKVASFTREAYVFYCDLEDTSDHVVGYVDLYTGEVIGGYYSGI